MRTGAFSFISSILVVSAIWLLLILPVNAVSNSVLITQVQLGGIGSGTAAQEYIELTNASSEAIDITDWCVYYASASSNSLGTKLGCFQALTITERLMVAPHTSAALATNEFKQTMPDLHIDISFSAGLSGSGGHVMLVDDSGAVMDKLGWGTAQFAEGTPAALPSAGQTLQRKLTSTYGDTDNNVTDFLSAGFAEPLPGGLFEAIDACLNEAEFPGLQAAVPEGYEANNDGICSQVKKRQCAAVVVSEVLPNPSGVDDGEEYIELFNAGTDVADVSTCALYVNGTPVLLSGLLPAKAYLLVSNVTLPNSTGATILLRTDGNEMTVKYPPSLKDDNAWVLIDGAWVITNRLTPAAENLPSLLQTETVTTAERQLAPCAPGKQRNPETNRCRNVESATQQQPCAPGQCRNPDTNRCRRVGLSSGLQPCGPGQSRNPETNRCRKIVTATALLKPCDEGEERNPQTNRCRKIQAVAGASAQAEPPTGSNGNYRVVGLTLFGALGYALFEYRQDILRRLGGVLAWVLRR